MNIFCLQLSSVLSTVDPYLNPGTGGLIIQLILGGLFAAGLAVRVFWSRIKRFVNRKQIASAAEAVVEKDDRR